MGRRPFSLRLVGLLLLGTILYAYGATSEVAWLFLLAFWIWLLALAAAFYAWWNHAGLHGRASIRAARRGPHSPLDWLPERVLLTAPSPEPLFEGDEIAAEVELRSARGVRGPAVIRGALAGEELSAAAGRVPGGGWSLRLAAGVARRGLLGGESWTVESGDPLGLFRLQRPAQAAGAALVYPVFTSLQAGRRAEELEADLAAPRAGAGTEIFGVREYRRGDPLRRIHWRSSARHGRLAVREFEPPGLRVLGIFCDAGWAPADAQVARIAASEAWDCVRAGGRALLWTPEGPSSRPTAALWDLLEWLALFPQADGTEPPPRVHDAIGLVARRGSPVVEALLEVRRRGGDARAWLVGSEVGEEALEGLPCRRAGLTWPL